MFSSPPDWLYVARLASAAPARERTAAWLSGADGAAERDEAGTVACQSRHMALCCLALGLVATSATGVSASSPSSFDLRDVDGRNYLSPVRNHHLPINSACASCWSVTTASVVGDRLNMAVAKAGVKGASRIEVSAQYLLNCVPGQHHCGYPGSASAAMAYILKHGIPDESCAPWQNAWPEGVQTCDALHTCAQMSIDPDTHKPAVSLASCPILLSCLRSTNNYYNSAWVRQY